MPPLPQKDEESLLPNKNALSTPAKASYSPSSSFFTKVLGTRKAPAHRVSESLDYEPLQNKLYQHQLHERREGRKKLYGYTGHTLAKFVVTFATGIATGILASGLTYCVNWLHEWKQGIIQQTLDGAPSAPGRTEGTLSDDASHIFMAVLKFWLFGGVLVTAATALVQYWAPAASGAGVTLVMAYLNGNHIPHLLRPSTLVAKFVGTVASVSSGLPMGPEGPMVHIGACVASVISYVDCKLVRNGKLRSVFGQLRLKRERDSKDKLKVLDDIVSDTDHREFISAGVSAGMAAAFGAPIGGVLYSMEEACSFWSRKVAWRCFIAGTLSTFTIQIMTKGAAHGAIAYSNLVRMEIKDWLMQLPFLLVNFVMAGLLGAAFNSMRMWLWKLRAAKTMHILRILEVLGLLVLVGLCAFFFAWTAGTCIDLPEDWWKDEQVGGQREYGVRFLCGEQQHNDLATLFLSSTHHTIVRLFSMGRLTSVDPSTDSFHSSFSPGSLALYTLVYLVLMSLGAGLAIPGGLFMPSIVVGASWGGMWGILVRSWVPLHWNVQPGLYALLAATGVLGGVFRSVISLVVLMVEGTQGIEFLPGIILAVVVSNWVAHYIHHDGVYESELERTGNVYMLRDEPPHRLHTLTTKDIMATGVMGFRSIESVPKILEVLSNTTHNGFPVYVSEDDPESGEVFLDLEGVKLDVGAGEGLGGSEEALYKQQQQQSLCHLQLDQQGLGRHQLKKHQQQQLLHDFQRQHGNNARQHHSGSSQSLQAHAAGAVQGPASRPHTTTESTGRGCTNGGSAGDSAGEIGLSGVGPRAGGCLSNGSVAGGYLSNGSVASGVLLPPPTGAPGPTLQPGSTSHATHIGTEPQSQPSGALPPTQATQPQFPPQPSHTPPSTHTTLSAPLLLHRPHAPLPPLASPPPSIASAVANMQPRMRLEGFILRSQLLVLLHRRHFCDAHGQPVGRDPCDKYDLELETEMRTFFRRYYTHSRYQSATPAALDELAMRGTNMQKYACGLYLDLRPFMNRAPFTIRTDCSAARAHQVFMGIGLRHLLVVNSAGRVVGMITRKDLDHAAGHGWWRMSAVAEPPRNSTKSRFWSSVGFLRSLVGSTPSRNPQLHQPCVMPEEPQQEGSTLRQERSLDMPQQGQPLGQGLEASAQQQGPPGAQHGQELQLQEQQQDQQQHKEPLQ